MGQIKEESDPTRSPAIILTNHRRSQEEIFTLLWTYKHKYRLRGNQIVVKIKTV